jgi:co-chaperonin GroES (HSP10)
MMAQAPAPARACALGTVKTIAGNTVTLTTDAGKAFTITVADGAKVLQLSPGSTDLKTAQTIALTDINVGDRILASGAAGSGEGTVTALRVILMKSTDIAAKHASEEEDWQKRGISGIVVSASGASFTVTVGAKKITVQTTPATIFRRYAGDSVKVSDAIKGTSDQIHVGDQLSARGDKSADGTTVTAEEIISGSFRNLSGLLIAVDSAAGTVTLKDLATNKTVKVAITSNSDLRHLPEQAAARFAARAKGDAPATGQAAPAGPAAGGQRASGSAGRDLSRMLSRLPAETVADLKTGEAVMIVASNTTASNGQGNTFTAVTMLSGVEPILSATPNGAAPVTLSPWNMGGGAPEAGGGS